MKVGSVKMLFGGLLCTCNYISCFAKLTQPCIFLFWPAIIRNLSDNLVTSWFGQQNVLKYSQLIYWTKAIIEPKIKVISVKMHFCWPYLNFQLTIMFCKTDSLGWLPIMVRNNSRPRLQLWQKSRSYLLKCPYCTFNIVSRPTKPSHPRSF